MRPENKITAALLLAAFLFGCLDYSKLRAEETEKPPVYVLTMITGFDRVPRKTQEFDTYKRLDKCEREAERLLLLTDDSDPRYFEIIFCVPRQPRPKK